MCGEAERSESRARGRARRVGRGSGGEIYRIFEIPVHSACRTRRLHFSTASIYLSLFSARTLLSAPTNTLALFPPLPFILDLTPLSRAFPLHPPSSRLSPSFSFQRRFGSANDSRFLNFAATCRQDTFPSCGPGRFPGKEHGGGN